MGFDGTARYQYTRIQSNKGDGGLGGVSDPEQVPFSGAHLQTLPVLWLAFGSSCYLNGHEKQLVPPYLYEADRPVLEVRVQRRADKARLPEKIIFYTPDGQEDAVYHANRFTNVVGIEIPLHFELTSYRGPGPGEHGQQVRRRFEAQVQTLKPSCTIGDFRPQLNSEVTAEIRDFRLQFPPSTTPRGDSLDYITNKWLSLSEVTNLPSFDHYLKFRGRGFKGPVVVPILPDPILR
jgi:hypothetical protein